MSLAVDVMNEMKTCGCLVWCGEGGSVSKRMGRIGFRCLPPAVRRADLSPHLSHPHTLALSARAATASLARPGSLASSGAPAASRAFTTLRTAARGRSTSSDDGGSGAGEGEAAAIETEGRRAIDDEE